MPTVAILVDGLQVGGSERQALLLADGLKARGHEASLLSLRGDGPMADACRAAGVPVDAVSLRYPFCWWRLPVNLHRACRLLRRYRPDCVLGFGSVPNLYAPLLKRRVGLSRVVWCQRNAGRDRPPAALERLALRRADAFVANSPAGADMLTASGIAASRVTMIPNGVRLPARVTPPGDWRRRFGVPDGTLMACMLANLRPPKDPFTVLRAWARVWPADTPDGGRAHLVLAGREDALTASVHAAIHDLRLEACVHLPGCVYDVTGLLQDADFAVFASVSEGLPNGVLEPMAAGLPVVATDMLGTRYALGEDMREWLFPVGDDVALAGLIKRLSGDAGLRAALGRRNRTRVQSEFSVHALADRILDIISG